MSILLCLYLLCAVLLTFYGINCHVLIRLFKQRHVHTRTAIRNRIKAFYGGPLPIENPEMFEERLPFVTTQLPIYNEFNVAERLIEAAAAMAYPRTRHEIQVLDDSTDDTRRLVAAKVAKLRQKGINILQITREDRDGFKAGALKNGLAHASGEFLAIFDADFVPPRDFLLRAIPCFSGEPDIGFVQARWGYLNRNQSLITRLQSIGIDGHFMVEQSARNSRGLLMNFNGTAGVFRKQAILAAGNWQSDTLTEDMDLSYRIQLAGWRCRYLVDLIAPSEIPNNINAFKNQQFRWAKGSIQTAIKLLPAVMRSNFSRFAKLQAFMHLTHYCIHPLMLFLAVMALPVLLIGQPDVPTFLFAAFGTLLALSCTGPSRLYLVAENAIGNSPLKTILHIPVMVCFGCGLAVNNTRAVLEAVFGKQSGFIRTPKSGFKSRKNYVPVKSVIYLLEMLTGFWCLAGTIVYFSSNQILVGHFLLIYAIGYLSIGFLSWRHSIKTP